VGKGLLSALVLRPERSGGVLHFFGASESILLGGETLEKGRVR
jgi:hypothetical protein